MPTPDPDAVVELTDAVRELLLIGPAIRASVAAGRDTAEAVGDLKASLGSVAQGLTTVVNQHAEVLDSACHSLDALIAVVNALTAGVAQMEATTDAAADLLTSLSKTVSLGNKAAIAGLTNVHAAIARLSGDVDAGESWKLGNPPPDDD